VAPFRALCEQREVLDKKGTVLAFLFGDRKFPTDFLIRRRQQYLKGSVWQKQMSPFSRDSGTKNTSVQHKMLWEWARSCWMVESELFFMYAVMLKKNGKDVGYWLKAKLYNNRVEITYEKGRGVGIVKTSNFNPLSSRYLLRLPVDCERYQGKCIYGTKNLNKKELSGDEHIQGPERFS